MPLPTFLIIGAPKCGTTSLYHFLSQHPQICMSDEKEPYFFCYSGREFAFGGPGGEEFARSIVTQQGDYEALFRPVRDHAAIGEATPFYLYCPAAPERIRQLVPNARLIAILKNPVDRAFSHYLHFRLRYAEPLETFEEALNAEAGRVAANWGPGYHYQRLGFYAAQLKRYRSCFEAQQIKVCLQSDLSQFPGRTLEECFDFLGVRRELALDTSSRYNVTGVPRHPALHAVLFKASPWKSLLKALLPAGLRDRMRERLRSWNLEKPVLARQTRLRLVEDYREDVMELQDLIGRDLSGWLSS